MPTDSAKASTDECSANLTGGGMLGRVLCGSSHFAVIATDAAGLIQVFNAGAEALLGYGAAEVVGRLTPADLSDPLEQAARSCALSLELAVPIAPGFEALVARAAIGMEDLYELTYLHRDGHRLPTQVSVTALNDDQGARLGYVLIGMALRQPAPSAHTTAATGLEVDADARKEIDEERLKLDQRLRDQQYYTRSLIEANIDAIMTTDPQGIITDVNKQMEALTGCTRDELIGAPFKHFFTNPERAEATIKLALTEGKVTNYELTAIRRDGKETVVSYNATTFHDRHRRLQGVFAAARDVTVSKRLDQVLIERNNELQGAKVAAERANLSKSDFLSSMSHELRSPLNAILGFAQLMEFESPAPTASQKESITQILKAGWHLLNLINEILDLAKIESGKFSLSPESVSLEEVMEECQGIIEGQAHKRGLTLTFPSFDRPCYIHADRTRLKQILINLLSNAVKYNREQGTVTVSFARNTMGRIRISIRDGGSGLTPDQVEKLFQPFNRLGQEGSTEEGTGIGLVVAKQLIELMGGVIRVESTVGVGTVFWFDLMAGVEPQYALDHEDHPKPAVEIVHTRDYVLLYVEDNPANLALVEQLVARRPELRLLTAMTGMVGLELARSAHPDVILMDINLPDFSGLEVLRLLRQDSGTSHIPVVAISANAMPHDIKKGLRAGFFQYLTKPIRINEFNETLNTAMAFAEAAREPEAASQP